MNPNSAAPYERHERAFWIWFGIATGSTVVLTWLYNSDLAPAVDLPDNSLVHVITTIAGTSAIFAVLAVWAGLGLQSRRSNILIATLGLAASGAIAGALSPALGRMATITTLGILSGAPLAIGALLSALMRWEDRRGLVEPGKLARYARNSLSVLVAVGTLASLWAWSILDATGFFDFKYHRAPSRPGFEFLGVVEATVFSDWFLLALAIAWALFAFFASARMMILAFAALLAANWLFATVVSLWPPASDPYHWSEGIVFRSLLTSLGVFTASIGSFARGVSGYGTQRLTPHSPA